MAEENDRWSIGLGGELPIGFGLNLAADSQAMSAFSEMSDDEKKRIVDESRQIESREDMKQFVKRIGESYQ